MSIRIADSSLSASWSNYVQTHPDGLPYHMPSWQQAIKYAYGFDSFCLIAEDSGDVRGILPLTRFHHPFRKRSLISLPYCDAAGVLADDQVIATNLINYAFELAAECNCNYQIRSAEPLAVTGENRTGKVRMVLELPNSAADLMEALKSKLRSQVKKPLRDGLIAKLGGGELVDDFLQVFSENMRDLGSPVHSRRWINAILKYFGEQAVVAVVYTPEREPAAGGILLKQPTTVCVPWASSLRRYNALNPNMLLYWTLLSHAAETGHRYFDFGRSSPGEGTYKFKEQWGSRPRELYWYTSPERHLTNERAYAIKLKVRVMCGSFWRKMPLPMANSIGPAIRKYISL
jgi:FemAB-related protein (PEP-CTERM system-associated)